MKTRYGVVFSQIFTFLFFTQVYSQWERLTDIREIRSYDQIQKEDNALLLNSTSLDSFMTATMTTYHIPGLSACILKEDSLVWHNAYGYADVERKIPVTDSTLFYLASISKTITGVALMQLYERGLFHLDDNVNHYLPPDLQVVNPSYPNSPITFKMLLSHVSSINDNSNVLESLATVGDSPIPLHDFLKNYLMPGGTYYTDASYDSLPPASTFNYSNTATALLGYLVEAITDTAFDEYCQQHIFAPLSMNETSWFLANLDTSHVARPYQWTSSGYKPYPHWGKPIYPASSLRTSSLQLARFLNAFMQKGTLGDIRILDSSTVALMTTAHYPEIPISYIFSQGLIWRQVYNRDRLVWGHFGGYRGATTEMYYYEPEKSGVIVLTNGEYPQSAMGIWNIMSTLFDYAAGIYLHAKIMANDSLNFVADFGGQDTAELTLLNIGLHTLQISNIEISGTHFQLTDPLIYPLSLNYNAILKINLRFTSAAQSSVTDTLKLFSNDPHTPVKLVLLRGNTIHPAQAGAVYAVTGLQSSGVFLTLDPDSGNGNVVGFSGFSEITGIAIQPSGAVYGTIGSLASTKLVKIDAQSGRAFTTITIPVPQLRAIAFDTNDDLYIANITNSKLYLINPLTGDTTFVGRPAITYLSGLAINPLDGQLWGTGAFDDEIYKINKRTGEATLIGKTGFEKTSDLAFDAAGNLYGLSGFTRLNLPSDFIKIDTTTAIGTLVGSTGFKSVLSLAIIGKIPTDIKNFAVEILPTQYDLRQNYPNPFNPSTTIEFALPKSAFVKLKIYNLLGEEVATLVSEKLPAGNHKRKWEAKGLASGVYVYRLEAGEFVEARKLTLLQ